MDKRERNAVASEARSALGAARGTWRTWRTSLDRDRDVMLQKLPSGAQVPTSGKFHNKENETAAKSMHDLTGGPNRVWSIFAPDIASSRPNHVLRSTF